MKKIEKQNVHLLTDINISKIEENNWKIIKEQTDSYFIDDTNNPQYLKYPGFVFSSKEAAENYNFIFKDFKQKNVYTPSRGNLSKENNYIFLGIRPSHTMPNQKDLSGYPAWLLGGSSSLLHKLLYDCNIYPYMGNIYNNPTQPFNKDFTFIFKEIITILYIYKNNYNKSKLNIVFLGNYDEYPEFISKLKNHDVYKNLGINVNAYSIWHPAYLLRSWSNEKYEHWKKQLTEKLRTI